MNRLTAISLFAAGSLAISLASCTESPLTAPDDASRTSSVDAKLISAPAGSEIVDDTYIVVFRDDAAPLHGGLMKIAASYEQQYPDIEIDATFESAFKGFSARIPESRLRSLLDDPRVLFIEQDRYVSIDPGGLMKRGGTTTTTAPAPTSTQKLDWGVSYIGGDSSSTKSGDGSGAVSGVEVFVLDTGIDPNHSDLNVVGGINYGNLDLDSTQWGDEHGHGTHVAGIIGARDNDAATVGVAPGVRLYSVKVFGASGSGTMTGIVRGIEWVGRQRTARPTTPMVANMSLVTTASWALDQAVKKLIDSNVTVVVAAGNSTDLASNYSPARLAAAITVAATSSTGALASFSNYGSAVDLLAPGVSIVSTRWQGGTTTKSGTSMATPHVAGAAALYLSLTGNGSKTPSEVASALVASAPAWGSSLPSGTPNRMLRVRSY